MSDDLISLQAAIEAIEDLHDCYNGFSDTYDKACIIGVLEEVPSTQPTTCEYWDNESSFCALYRPSAQPEQCEFCRNRELDDGDTLYISADWDGGIGFDFIRDIHYCPKCGRRL